MSWFDLPVAIAFGTAGFLLWGWRQARKLDKDAAAKAQALKRGGGRG